MGTLFPGALDTFPNPDAPTLLDAAGYEHDVQHAAANDAIEAVQGELGTDPAGGQATVRARLDEWVMGRNASHVVWTSGTYVHNQVTSSTSSIGYSASMNTVYYVPWFCPYSVTVDRVAVEVAYVRTDANATLGLYDTTTDYLPGSRIATFGEIDCTTTGVKELTVSQAVTGGKAYWLALHNEIANTQYRCGGGDAASLLDATTMGSPFQFLTESVAYTSGLPATANPTGGSTTVSTWLFFLRRA